MKSAWLLVALIAIPAIGKPLLDDIEDAPPLAAPSGDPEKRITEAPRPVATATQTQGEDEEPAPPPKPTRVGPAPKAEESSPAPEAKPSAPPEPAEPEGPALGPVEELRDAPPLVPKGSSAMPWAHPLFGLRNPRLLELSGRLDVAFLAGGSVQQGFSLPSVRMTAAGNTGEIIHYRLSIGQTREFSSAQLPQMMPVEAWVEFRDEWGGAQNPQRLRWRIGMFTPAGAPWWTPDLSDVPMPDYHEIDRALLLSRDLGLQLTYEPFGDRLSVSLGVYNGTGALALNTNSARAFGGQIEVRQSERGMRYGIGASAYRVMQSSSGSVNYRSDFVGTFFARADYLPWRLSLTGEAIGGNLEDAIRSANPIGGAATINLGFFDWLQIFGRGETLTNSGSGTGSLRHIQAGPVFELERGAQAWLLYDYEDAGSQGGSPQQQLVFRLRLTL